MNTLNIESNVEHYTEKSVKLNAAIIFNLNVRIIYMEINFIFKFKKRRKSTC